MQHTGETLEHQFCNNKMLMLYRDSTNSREHCARHIASLVPSSTIVTAVDVFRGLDKKSCNGKAYLLDSPSHLRMLVKTQE